MSPKQRRTPHPTAATQKLRHSYYRPAKAKQTTAPEAEESALIKHTFKWRYAILALLLLLLVPFLVIGIWDLRNFADASKKMFGTNSILGLLPATPLQNDDGRVNILLVGYSADDPNHAGADLTDSILIMSIDQTDASKSYMLSVPRDLYVNIPEYGGAKINEAFQFGERTAFQEAGYPHGGMGLLRKIVSENLDIELHYQALINYTAVRDVVDALGGVTITIESPDSRGLYDPNFQDFEGGPLLLTNGVHTISGVTALQLTRARGATSGSYGFPESDFNRTQNQQLVVAAILKELNWTLVLDPRTNGKIFDAVANNVAIDFKLSEVIPLYRLLLRTPPTDIQSFTLRTLNGQNYLSGYTNSTGQAALIPSAGIYDYSQIQAAIRELDL